MCKPDQGQPAKWLPYS